MQLGTDSTNPNNKIALGALCSVQLGAGPYKVELIWKTKAVVFAHNNKTFYMNPMNKGTLVPGSNPAGCRAIVFMYLNSRYHFCF